MHALKHERIRWSKWAAWVALWLLPVAAFAADDCNLAVTLTTANEARVALVIGNSNYKSAPLRNPVNDAKAIAEKLRGLGFQVTLKLDQDQKSMAEAIRVFGNQLKTGGAGLFYYAGHGMQVKGRNFLIPVDADIQNEDEVPYRSVDANEVLSKMETAKNRLNLMILDACRNNPFSRKFRSSAQGLARMDAPSGTFVAFATAPGLVTSDGTSSNGLYTQHLLASLGQSGVPVEQIFKHVRAGVMKDTRNAQVPWESPSLVDDFYLGPAAAAVKTWTDPTTGMEFVWIPKGCYIMGSPKKESGRFDDEYQHEACVKGYWLSKYEVTNSQYRMFNSFHDSGRYEGSSLNGDAQPVVNVSWNDATAYAEWLSSKTGETFRLPTETEWEYAARAGTETARYWGDEDSQLCRHANVADRTAQVAGMSWAYDGCNDGCKISAPAGRFAPNAWGLYDMLGNVWEWTASPPYDHAYPGSPKRQWYFGKRIEEAPPNDQAYSGGEKNAATNDENGLRVVRGGSWKDLPRSVRSAYRPRLTQGQRQNFLGFRLARSP